MFDDIIKKPKLRMLKAEWTIELKQDLNAYYDEDLFDSIMEDVERELIKEKYGSLKGLGNDVHLQYDTSEEKFVEDYEKWMEDYQKLSKKPVIYTPYIPLVVHEYPIAKPVEFIVFNYVITKTGLQYV